jgi:hypothetical protein
MITMAPPFVDSDLDVIRVSDAWTVRRIAHSLLNNASRGGRECRATARAKKGTTVRAFSASRIASDICGTLRASLLHVMATSGRNDMGSFVVVTLDRVTQGVTEIRSVLDSVGITAELVESGRQLRWNTAVVLRIPEHRIPEALLALGLKGFTDVTAYQSSEAESWGGSEARRAAVGSDDPSQTEGAERC